MRQYVPELGISLERGTEEVPDDGRFHVVRNGEVVASYRQLKAAQKRYKELIEEAGGYPMRDRQPMTKEERLELLIHEDTQRNLDLSDFYWGAAGKKHKGKKYSG